MHRLKLIYKKAKRTFKASKNVWWWFVIFKFSCKLNVTLWRWAVGNLGEVLVNACDYIIGRNLDTVIPYGGTRHKDCRLHRGWGWQNSLVEPTILMPYQHTCTSVVYHCAQEKRLHKSHFKNLSNLFPVIAGYFPDPAIFLARFGIFLTGFLWRLTINDLHPSRVLRLSAKKVTLSCLAITLDSAICPTQLERRPHFRF